MFYFRSNFTAKFFNRITNSGNKFFTHRFQLFIITTTHIAFNYNKVRHYVSRYTTADDANIAGSFFVNTTIAFYFRQSFCRNHNSVDAFFRFYAAMSGFAMYANLPFILTRRTNNNFTRRTFAVKSISHFCFQLASIHATRTVHAAFFRNSEKNLNVAVFSVFFHKHAYAFKNAYHTGLIITAQNGSSIAIKIAVFLHNSSATARFATIHVCRKQHASSTCLITGQECPQVTAVAAKLFTCIVFFYSKSQNF